MRYLLIFCVICSSPLLAADNFSNMAPVLSDTPEQREITPGEPGEHQPVVIDVVLHDRDAILNMLKRAETLAMTPNPAERPRQIALVLHGPEIEHFRISSYGENKEIVDLAAKLDAFNVIDIKMCNTAMNMLEVDRQEVPAFIEIVPFGPAEIQRLQGQGYLKL
jgi:intracellular sulfur oxidation DsrE/DsrF family protein